MSATSARRVAGVGAHAQGCQAAAPWRGSARPVVRGRCGPGCAGRRWRCRVVAVHLPHQTDSGGFGPGEVGRDGVGRRGVRRGPGAVPGSITRPARLICGFGPPVSYSPISPPRTGRRRTPRVSQPSLIMFRRQARLSDGPGFLRDDPLRARSAKSGGDDDAAERDGSVVVGRFGLRGVPAGPIAGWLMVGGVPVHRVPKGDHAETDQPERHRPRHGVQPSTDRRAIPHQARNWVDWPPNSARRNTGPAPAAARPGRHSHRVHVAAVSGSRVVHSLRT